MKERFLEAILQQTERKLAGPGRPGTVDGLVAGGALGGAAPCHGRARSHHAARGGLTPASKGARWRPGASHRSIASRGSRGTGKPRTHCAARMRKCGCLKSTDQNCERYAAPYSASYAGLTRVSITLRTTLRRGWIAGSSPAMTEVACPGRDAAFFMPLRRTGTPVTDLASWTPAQQRTASQEP